MEKFDIQKFRKEQHTSLTDSSSYIGVTDL